MIKKYALITNGKVHDVFHTEDAATNMGIELSSLNIMENFYVQPIYIELSDDEINKLYQERIECYDILLDTLNILYNEYNVSEDYEGCIENDMGIIYYAYNQNFDANRSHWDNIRATINYLKNMKDTNFDYLNICKRKK